MTQSNMEEIKDIGPYTLVKIIDYTPPSIPNPNKEVFYIIDRDKNLYLWKFQGFQETVGAHPGLHEKYVDCPGIYATQQEAEETLNKFLSQQKES